MRFLRVGLLIAFAVSQFTVLPVARASSSGVVISHVIAGEVHNQTTYHNAEFVALYNNTDVDIDVTGYCLWSGDSTVTVLACVQAEANAQVYIKARHYLTFASTTFAANHGYVPDTSYAAANKITVGGDSVFIKNAQQQEVDRITWGSGVLATGSTLQRNQTADGSNVFVDTDTPGVGDFSALPLLIYPANSSYDVVTVVDVCPNRTGIQQAMPAGYLADEQGNCQPDSCLNIVGLQVSVPDRYDSDTMGTCTEHDECDNIAGIQATIPTNMMRGEDNDCRWDVSPLVLSELLPNASGSDTGNEFIEIYNPNEHTVDLTLYGLIIGANGDKYVPFPAGLTIAPGEYRAFSDQQLKFTLVNTSSRVLLTAADGATYGDSGIYDTPLDGYSWALVDEVWQYTNQPTPATANVPSVAEEVVIDTTDAPAPCPAGKYRHPLTNRCRNSETDATMLSACEADQYRSPETGRCRKITTTSVTPCKDGQYRSEETNRCRNIIAASTQKPCSDNQYRSEETNRCRNLTSTNIPESAFAVQSVKDGAMAFVGWWALGGVGLLAVGYAAWEWRSEIWAGFGRAASYLSGKK